MSKSKSILFSDPGLLLRQGRRDWPWPTHQHYGKSSWFCVGPLETKSVVTFYINFAQLWWGQGPLSLFLHSAYGSCSSVDFNPFFIKLNERLI